MYIKQRTINGRIEVFNLLTNSWEESNENCNLKNIPDTKDILRSGNPYSILNKIEEVEVI